MRRDADFAISDHITLTYQGSDQLLAAMRTYEAYVAGETLADGMVESVPEDGAFTQDFAIDDETLTLGIKQVS